MNYQLVVFLNKLKKLIFGVLWVVVLGSAICSITLSLITRIPISLNTLALVIILLFVLLFPGLRKIKMGTIELDKEETWMPEEKQLLEFY